MNVFDPFYSISYTPRYSIDINMEELNTSSHPAHTNNNNNNDCNGNIAETQRQISMILDYVYELIAPCDTIRVPIINNNNNRNSNKHLEVMTQNGNSKVTTEHRTTTVNINRANCRLRISERRISLWALSCL